MVKIRTNSRDDESFYEKPYVKKTLIGAVALASTAAIGYAAYYNRARLPANPLANRMGWGNWDNAKTALTTVGKTITIVASGISGCFAGALLCGYWESNRKKSLSSGAWASSIVGGTVIGSMLVGYPLGAMKTVCFVSATILGGTIGLISIDDNDSDLKRTTKIVGGISTGLSLAGAAFYSGLVSAAVPLTASTYQRAVELVKNYPSETCKVVFLAFLCFKVLPKLNGPALRFLREDVLQAKEWDPRYYKLISYKKTRMLGLALFGLGCFGLFSKSLPVDADFLRKAVAVGVGATIPILAYNLTRSSGANLAYERLSNDVENLKENLQVIRDRSKLDDKFSAQQREVARALDNREKNVCNKLSGKIDEVSVALGKRLDNLENAIEVEEMPNPQLEEETFG